MKNITLSKILFNTALFVLLPLGSFCQTQLSFENFNSGFGIWTSGGGNVVIDGTAPYEGSNSARFRGTTNMTLTTPISGINTLPYNKVDVKFFLRSFASTGETITVQYRPNAFASWVDVRVYTLDGNKDIKGNGVYYGFYATLFSTNFTFTALSQFRFIANLGSSGSYFYLDSVSITGTTYNTIIKAPGGITAGLETWLKADKIDGTGVIADNAVVNKWEDVGKGNDANVIDPTGSAFTNKPVYKNNGTNNINFNPVVNFNNNPSASVQNYTGLTNRAELNGTGGFYTNEQFIVVLNDNPPTINSTTASEDIFCAQGGAVNPWDNDATGFGFGKYSVRFDSEVISYAHNSSPNPPLTPINSRGYGVALNSTTASYTNFAGIISSRNKSTLNGQELYVNAAKIDNFEVGVPQFANFGNRRYWLGRSQVYDGSFGGRIAEVITYSARKNDISERRRIESYLAIKYGITLGINGVSLDYQDPAGNVIWNVSANTGYNFDIAGIGRDDASELLQKQSKSINTTEVMTIGLTDILPTNNLNTSTFLNDRNYLVWGSNGGNMVNSGTPINVDLGPTTITTITEVVNRRWKVIETNGDVATTRVSIPTAAFVSGLPALLPTDAYVMVVATNAAFTTGVETVFMTTSGSNQTLLYDFDATRFITFGVAHRATNPLHITLDGVDDYVRIGNANEIGASFSVMTWVRPNGNNTLADERTIIAKKQDALRGYQIVLQLDNKIRVEWGVGGALQSAISNTAIPDAKWHNIAVTFESNTLNIYIDGVLDKSVSIAVNPVTTSGVFSIGAQYRDKNNIVNLWKGDIDELRMWNRAVTPTEIRFIMNQEILQNGFGTVGTIIPSTITKTDISTLTWSSLFAYYSMNSYIGTHLDDDSFDVNRGSLVIPDKISISLQTAPMPYISNTNGLWSTNATWRNGVIQDVPYSLSIINSTTPIEWNIVRTRHNVDSNGNKVVLGLFVDNNTLSATNDTKLEVTHYLNLSSKIDLDGMSQLIQTVDSDLDPTSAGSINKDQLGSKNMFNYNYWASPVGAINNTTNNNAFTVAGVMKDGTTATPQNILWTTGYNGSPTSPITLSSYWIFKFQNVTNSYANWSSVGTAGSLTAGQGFTLKGSGTATANQNYSFVGKPNNGNIATPIAGNNLNLSGNPYPSAINTSKFITDNNLSLVGTLYFWEHSSLNNTHSLANYQGGYSARNLTGGVPPVAPAGISGTGGITKTPGQFIPVGQGFFVQATAAGGTVKFNNTQRKFEKENGGNSNTLFKSAMTSVNHFTNNADDEIQEDTFMKVRVGFNSSDNYHRQILLGFMDDNATTGIDNGYDGVLFESNPSEMYFNNSGSKLMIQGDTYFNENSSFPISIRNATAGDIQFNLDGTENFDPNQGINIYDMETGIYHDIRTNAAQINVPAGTIDNRFFLRFKTQALSINNNSFDSNIIASFANSNNTLSIKNNLANVTVTSVAMFNLIGQSLKTVKVTDQDQTNILIPVQNLSTGTYIVKIITTEGTFSKKIIIK